MAQLRPITIALNLANAGKGVFRGQDAVAAGLSRSQLTTLVRSGAIVRILPDVYGPGGGDRAHDVLLRAALAWSGPEAAATSVSTAALFRLEGIRAVRPTISVPHNSRKRHPSVDVRRHTSREPLMLRSVGGIRTVGIEAALCALLGDVDGDVAEAAFEDARRRGLTSIPAVTAYLDRYCGQGMRGVRALRGLVRELDPVHPSNSVLEVRTRRLLQANGLGDHVREFPLEWNGRRYRFDFCFPAQRVILETNGRRWHDDVADYEFDQEKWSVPARHGYRIVFATWAKVCDSPRQLLAELQSAIAGGGVAA